MNAQKTNLQDSPRKPRIIQVGKSRFSIWLEWEEEKPLREINDDYANIIVDLLDGRAYWINVWTYEFLQTVVHSDIINQEGGKGLFVVPPDLFVKTLSRECLETTIIALMQEGGLDFMLKPSTFRLQYSGQWIGSFEMENCAEIERRLFERIGPMPPFYGHHLYLLAHNVYKNEIAVGLENKSIAVVPYPKANLKEKDIQFFKNKKDFWGRKLRYEIG